MNKISYYIALTLIISYGIYLRFYELDTGSFWIDEGYSSIVSYFSYLNNLVPKLANGDLYLSQYFFTITQNISFSLFGISDFSARIPSFVFSIFSIILYFIFANNIFKNTKNKYIYMVFIMFLFVFSTWQIIWAREARFYELLSFLYLLNIYFLWRYFVKNDKDIFNYFIIVLFLSIIFHPFFLSILVISIVLFLYKSIKDKTQYKKLFYLFLGLNIYLIIDLVSRYITSGQSNLTQTITQINSNLDFNFFTYINFYLNSIYRELGIIFISYIVMIIYFVIKRKYIEFILFGVIFLVNIIVLSYGYMAHTRYMFHMYSIITFIGSLGMILFANYIFKKLNGKKIIIIILLVLSVFTIIKTYNLTIIPQRFYYIDFTSPKPNFKMAYDFLRENHKDEKIVSGFPHLCYWYNINDFKKCEYAININLTGNKNLNDYLEKREKEKYSNIRYLKNLDELETNKNYFFILDDLSIKNMVNKQLFNDVINNCTMIYKDIGNYETSSFIGIWSCNIKKK